MVVLNGDFALAFHPASIAIVGVSGSETTRRFFGPYGGFSTLSNLLDLGYEGRIYPINPHASEILGVKAYPTIGSLPEVPDLVIITLPASLTPQALKDCAAAGALNAHIMTSGFGETAQPEGVRLQAELKQIALENNIRLIGPNCMGLQVPSSRISTFEMRPQLSGPVSWASQSGSIMHTILGLSKNYGIGFSKLISCGNSLVLDITDYVEFLSNDPETGIICMYIEGISEGRRLLDIVRRTNPAKPCIVWKVGLTDSGARAAMSHTGQLSGQRHTWDAFFRQTGAVPIHSVEDLNDILMTFLYMPRIKSNKVAVITAGGGITVAAGDVVAEEGLIAPALDPSTIDKLIKSISLVNQGVANPLDLPDTIFQMDLLKTVFTIVADDPNIDVLLLTWSTIGFSFPDYAEKFVSLITDIAKNHLGGKPLVIANNPLSTPPIDIPRNASDIGPQKWINQLIKSGIPVYDNLPRACRALAKFEQYHSYIAEHK